MGSAKAPKVVAGWNWKSVPLFYGVVQDFPLRGQNVSPPPPPPPPPHPPPPNLLLLLLLLHPPRKIPTLAFVSFLFLPTATSCSVPDSAMPSFPSSCFILLLLLPCALSSLLILPPPSTATGPRISLVFVHGADVPNTAYVRVRALLQLQTVTL